MAHAGARDAAGAADGDARPGHPGPAAPVAAEDDARAHAGDPAADVELLRGRAALPRRSSRRATRAATLRCRSWAARCRRPSSTPTTTACPTSTRWGRSSRRPARRSRRRSSSPEGVDGSRDASGRALGPGGGPLYASIDVGQTFMAALERDLVPLLDPNPADGHETVLNAEAGAYVLFGSRAPAATKTYPPDPESAAPSAPVVLGYDGFDPDTSPLEDLVYALAVMMADPAMDDLIAARAVAPHEETPTRSRGSWASGSRSRRSPTRTPRRTCRRRRPCGTSCSTTSRSSSTSRTRSARAACSRTCCSPSATT